MINPAAITSATKRNQLVLALNICGDKFIDAMTTMTSNESVLKTDIKGRVQIRPNGVSNFWIFSREPWIAGPRFAVHPPSRSERDYGGRAAHGYAAGVCFLSSLHEPG